MRGSADMADVRVPQVFFGCEIMRRKQTLEMEPKLTPDFPFSDMRTVCSQLLGMTFVHTISLQFLSSSFVAAFLGLDSEAKNGVFFSGSRQAHEIIAPEAPCFHAALLSIPDAFWINRWRPLFANASSEGERCMKTRITSSVTLFVTIGFSEEPEGEQVAHGAEVNLGADKTPDWAGATPLLCTYPCPK